MHQHACMHDDGLKRECCIIQFVYVLQAPSNLLGTMRTSGAPCAELLRQQRSTGALAALASADAMIGTAPASSRFMTKGGRCSAAAVHAQTNSTTTTMPPMPADNSAGPSAGRLLSSAAAERYLQITSDDSNLLLDAAAKHSPVSFVQHAPAPAPSTPAPRHSTKVTSRTSDASVIQTPKRHASKRGMSPPIEKAVIHAHVAVQCPTVEGQSLVLTGRPKRLGHWDPKIRPAHALD